MARTSPNRLPRPLPLPSRLTFTDLCGVFFLLPARLVAREDPERLPQLCALVAREAVDGRVGGEAVLALAEGLSSVGQRQPLPSKVDI